MTIRRLIAAACVLACAALATGCGRPDPQQTFAQAVLNVNLLHGFAGPALQREFASPGVKLVDAKTGATAPLSRAELLQAKVDAIEAAYAKVKALGADGDARPMVEASRALFEFVLPVYRTEYRELASLYDGGAPADRIAALERAIADRYQARFGEMHGGLVEVGRAYAEGHDIRFRVVSTSPSRS